MRLAAPKVATIAPSFQRNWSCAFGFIVWTSFGLGREPDSRMPGVSLAPAMPRAANVDSQGFESEWREDEALNGKIGYHTCDNRLTCPKEQTDGAVATGPDFQGAATVRSCHYSRHSTCAAF